jgi:glc operon protein GlcG
MDEAFVIRGQVALSCKGSHVVLHAGEKKAAAIGVPMCIAVVDAGGNLLAFTRMDGARVPSVQISMTKAISAATRRVPTEKELGDDPFRGLRLAFASDNQVTAMKGGLPIIIDGQVVGGVGVSNGTPDQDTEVAQAGIDALLNG